MCFSQLSITSTTWSELAVTPSAVSRVGIFAQGANGSLVQIHTSITNESGVRVMDIISAPMVINDGASMLSPSSFASISYAQGSTGDYLKSQNALPIGSYTFCIEILSNTIEILDQYCESIRSNRDEFLTLIYPSNGDSIYTINPNLTWTHTGNFGDQNTRFYRIVLSEISKDQSVSDAINMNSPLWISTPLVEHSISYPISAPQLKEGHSYVWQVQLLYNSSVAQTSEVWKFSVASKPVYQDLEYISLTREKNRNLFEAYNHINVRFDEASNNREIEVTAQFSGDVSQVYKLPYELKVEPVVGGNNTYLLKVDVTSLLPEKKSYELFIKSGQEVSYSLNFIKK